MSKLFFLFLLPFAYAIKWTEYPSYSSESSRNLHSLTSGSLVSFLKSNNLSVIWFHPRNISSVDRNSYYLLRETFLRPAAERLRIPFAEFAITNDSAAIWRTLGVNDSDIDTVHVYSRLRRIVYYGLRTPDALVSFVEKLKCPKFTVIEGKADKKLFDLVDKVRVLAYVVPGSPFARAYAHASLAFGPSVKFFVITDPVVARRYGLTDRSVQLHRPGERSFVEVAPVGSVADIVNFVRDEAGKAFFQTHRLTRENIYSFFRESYDQPKFVLLTSSSQSPHASRFHKLLRRSVKNDTNVQISVIDVDQFPGMADYWKKNYGVDPSFKPALGYIALHNRTALWLDQKHLNATDGKESEQQNNRAISDFIGSIANGTTTLKQGKQVDLETGLPIVDETEENRQRPRLVEEGDLVDLSILEEEVLAHEGSYENENDFGIYNADKQRLRHGGVRYVNAEKKGRSAEADADRKSGLYDAAKSRLNYEGGETYEQKGSTKGPEVERRGVMLDEDKPFFIIEDEPVLKENPANKFEQDLTSFGTHSHLDAPSPSIAAQHYNAYKRHEEF